MTMKRTQFALASLAGLLGATCLSGAAFASGFGLREGAADWLGTAFAGDEAKAYDASTAWSNPAGMALLNQDEFDGNLSIISPSLKFTGTASNPIGGNVTGVSGGNGIAPAATGATFGVLTLGPDWRVGFGLTAPFGERVAYPTGWVGRYQSLVSSITDIAFSLAVSYKVNDQLSVGGGPVFDYFSARLTQSINAGLLSAGTGEDATSDVHGNNIGVGYNLGALYQLDANNRIGIDYRSRIAHSIDGAQIVTVPGIYNLAAPQVAAALSASTSGGKTALTLPDSLAVAYYTQVTPQLALMATVQWTDWSLFKSLTVVTANGAPPSEITEDYHNTIFAGVGANYHLTDKLMLQAGFAYDQSPINNANRTTRVPDEDHYDLGMGVQYQILPSTTLLAAYGHVFTPGGTINNTAVGGGLTPSGTITGKYADSDNSGTVAVNVKF
jgi:long-chain fatty acid transport protein